MSPARCIYYCALVRGNIMIKSLAVLHLVALITFGQIGANRSAVYGLVTDPSGSPVPDAKVTAIQSASGLERETTTDREGRYQLAALMPGEYEVRVQAGSVGAIVRDV